MVHVIKSLSAYVLGANTPIDYVLAKTIIKNSNIQKCKVILGILQRRMVIDMTPEDNDVASQATQAEGI